jgi:hypothetical protein
MSLQYKHESYIIKTIRQAVFDEARPNVWSASLPAFGLRSTGQSRSEAEEKLLVNLTAEVVQALLHGTSLRDINEDDSSWYGQATGEMEPSSPTTTELSHQDSLAVAQAVLNPPPANEYLEQAADEYRRFIGN